MNLDVSITIDSNYKNRSKTCNFMSANVKMSANSKIPMKTEKTLIKLMLN